MCIYFFFKSLKYVDNLLLVPKYAHTHTLTHSLIFLEEVH